MADTDTGVPLPTFVEHNGWIAESSSREQPGEDVLLSALAEPNDEPNDEPAAADAAVAAPAEGEVDAEATAAADDATETTETQPRETDGKYAKKESASERKGRIQAEINALTRAKREEERHVEMLRRERQQLETKPAAPVAAPVVDTPKPATEKPTWAAFDAAGKTWDEYQDARDEWVRADAVAQAERAWDARQKADAQKSAEAQQRAADEQVKRAHTERLAKARTEHPDFDEVIESLGQLDEDGEPVTPQTPFLRDVVLKHDQGHEVLYYFGKHPEHCKVLADLPLTNSMMAAVRETSSPTALLSYFATNPADVRRIANLSPASALVALGRLTAQVEGAKNGSPTPAPAPVTKAKPPIRPVGGSRGAVTEKSIEDLPFDQYVRKVNEMERARLR